jgi:hypothetical protein
MILDDPTAARIIFVGVPLILLVFAILISRRP